MAWLGVGPHIRGKFLVQKAKEMGVSPGKDFGLLAKGQSVMVGDKEIKPEDCMEAGQDPSVRSKIRLTPSGRHAKLTVRSPNAGFHAGPSRQRTDTSTASGRASH